MGKSKQNLGTKTFYKIIFLSLAQNDQEEGPGKTQIINRFINNKFSANNPRTIGLDFNPKAINLELNKSQEHQHLLLSIWDVSSQERFQSIMEMTGKDVHALIIVVDAIILAEKLSQQPALAEYLDRQYTHFLKHGLKNRVMYYVVNKIDKLNVQEAEQTYTSIQNAVGKWIETKQDARLQQEVFFTSAKENIGITELFSAIAKKCFEVFSQKPEKSSTFVKLIPPTGNHFPLKLKTKTETYYNQLPNTLDATQKAMMLLKDIYLEGNGWWMAVKKFFLGIFNPGKKRHIEQIQTILANYIEGTEEAISVQDVLTKLSTKVSDPTDDGTLSIIIAMINRSSKETQPLNPKASASSSKEEVKIETSQGADHSDRAKNKQPVTVTVNEITKKIKSLAVHGLGGKGSIYAPTQLLPTGAAEILEYVRKNHSDKQNYQASAANNIHTDVAKHDENLSKDEINEIAKICRQRLFGNTKVYGIFGGSSYRAKETTEFYAQGARGLSLK